MTTRVRVGVSAVALWILGAATSAYAQAPSGTEGDFSYAPSRLGAGQSVRVSGKCLWGGSGAGTRFHVGVSATESQPDGTIYGFSEEFQPAADGAVSGELPIPGSAPPGEYYIFANCAVEDQVFFNKSGPLTITANPAPRPQASITTVRSTPTSRPVASAPFSPASPADDVLSATTTSTGATTTTTGEPGSTNSAEPRPAKHTSDDSPVRAPVLLVGGLLALGALVWLGTLTRRRVS